MNLLDCTVIEITAPVHFKFERWWVPVKYTCYGQVGETNLMFTTEFEAKDIKIGYKFLA